MTTKMQGAGLIRNGEQRTHAVVKRIDAAKKKIEEEIDANDGIYPLNNGRLNEAEVCRRANVSNVTLAGPKHAETTKKNLKVWLEGVKKSSVVGRASVRAAVTSRVSDWQVKHEQIRQNYRIAELEMEEMRRKMEALEESNAALAELLKNSGQEKVKALLPRAK